MADWCWASAAAMAEAVRGCGCQDGEYLACEGTPENGQALPGLVPSGAATLAGGAGQPCVAGLTVQLGDLGLGQLLVDGRVHRGLLGDMAGLCPEDAAKASWCGSGDRAESGPRSP
jgi:hypothetical protein